MATVSPASAEDSYKHGRILAVEAGVTLQRAGEDVSEEAFRNLPFLPGDRLWTDADGRAELQFPPGTVVRLDRASKLDYAGHEEGKAEPIVLRLWSGSVFVHAHPTASDRLGVVTPAGMVRIDGHAVLRVDVEAGEVRVSVFAGEAVLDDTRQRVRLAAGERSVARWGEPMTAPRPFDVAQADGFSTWDGEREAAEARTGETAESLPEELQPYKKELDESGSWRNLGVTGWVWVPDVEAGWRPYWNGHWVWTTYGWTWVPSESWGWAPFHYGRWDHTDSLGWYWAPASSWGPAWVDWAVSDAYVGWCPLGRDDQPVTPWAVAGRGAGSRLASPGAWSLVRRADLGGRDLLRRLVSFDRVDPAAFQVGDGAALRPTRDAAHLGALPSPAAVRRKQSIGDFVRELQVDNKTQIPAPWTRGYGPPPPGVTGARYGVPPPADEAGEKEKDKPSLRGIAGAPGTTAAPPPAPAPAPLPVPASTGSSSRSSP